MLYLNLILFLLSLFVISAGNLSAFAGNPLCGSVYVSIYFFLQVNAHFFSLFSSLGIVGSIIFTLGAVCLGRKYLAHREKKGSLLYVHECNNGTYKYC